MFCKYCGNVISESARFCRFCGKQQDVIGAIDSTPLQSTQTVFPSANPTFNIVNVATQQAQKPRGSVTRLVLGILLIVYSVVMLFQSCAVYIIPATSNSGALGIFMSFGMLAGGITMVASRRGTIGGVIAGAMLIVFGGLTMIGIDDYPDLILYGVSQVIFGIVSIIVSLVRGRIINK